MDYLASAELVGAAASVKELRTLVVTLDEFDIPVEIRDLIDDELIKRESKMKFYGHELLSQFCDFSDESDIQIKSTLYNSKTLDMKDNSIDWDDMLTILDMTGTLELFYVDLTNVFSVKILPILSFDCQVKIHKVKGRSHLKTTKFSKEFAQMKTVADNITAVAEFICSVMFPREIRPSDKFVDTWSRQLSHLVRNHAVKSKRTLCDSDMECIRQLEISLMTFDLLSPEFFPLNNLEIQQNQKIVTQRMDLLTQVNKLLNSNDPNLVKVSEGTCRGGFFGHSGLKVNVAGDFKTGKEGVDRAFCLSECMISNQVHTLSDIIFSLMESLVVESMEIQSILLTVRDFISLFRAANREVIPMVVYNDTQFLSYQLLSLPYIFADILSAPGRPGNSMIFIDQVNLLYSLGKESLLSEIKLHKAFINSKFAANTLAILDLQGCSILHQSIKETIKFISNIYKNWSVSCTKKVVAEEECFYDCMGLILNHTLKKLFSVVYQAENVNILRLRQCFGLFQNFDKFMVLERATTEFPKPMAKYVPLWETYLKGKSDLLNLDLIHLKIRFKEVL